eukprot:CAMPEP_0198262380 /NCGR_PEP_ID=MMETSP1447-20131203/10893_1 /TAXON_ID=420782 /ORGANISM="Chaetoceros dichaeta, Strain CCMP1751" /LENGTH=178 /DNA_ID=CAMNT_0043950593 /DNA_START=130 /DNA_END=666 /DNA_ORIENTATION=+
MISDSTKRLRCSIQLIIAILSVPSSAPQQDTSWRRFDSNYLLSLGDSRHTEQPIEHNAPNPPLLPDHSMMPSSSPNESGGLISAHPSIRSVSYVDDTQDENINVDDTLGGPDDENSAISSAAVGNLAVAALITLMAAGAIYLQRKRCNKGNGDERSSGHQDSMSFYEDTMNSNRSDKS